MSTRRTFLQGLAALPAVAVPVAVLDAPGSPDADLIAAARRTRALAVLEERAVNRRCDAQARFEAVEPVVPDDCQAEIRATIHAITDECPTPVTLADNEILKEYMRRAQAAAGVIRQRHNAAVEAYDAEYLRLRRETGLIRAENLCDWLTDRLEDAVGRLVDLPATTSPGLRAKAEVWAEINKGGWGGCQAPWLDKLTSCIVREVIVIGGVA